MESADDVEKVRSHLRSLGITTHPVSVDACDALGVEDAFRISEPTTGATFEYFHSLRSAATPFEPSVAKIARLGHVVLFSAQHAASEKFFRRAVQLPRLRPDRRCG